jgi:hypothetical protein
VNVNFLVYWPGNRLKVPIELTNADQVTELKRGSCYLLQLNDFLEVTCKGEIPKKITYDLSEATKGTVIRLKDLVLPPGCEPTVDERFVVAVVKTSK